MTRTAHRHSVASECAAWGAAYVSGRPRGRGAPTGTARQRPPPKPKRHAATRG